MNYTVPQPQTNDNNAIFMLSFARASMHLGGVQRARLAPGGASLLTRAQNRTAAHILVSDLFPCSNSILCGLHQPHFDFVVAFIHTLILHVHSNLTGSSLNLVTTVALIYNYILNLTNT